MDLLTLRQQFVQISGRHDLATTTTKPHDVDNGADFFINAAISYLEKRFNTLKSKASYFKEVAAGAWYLAMQNCLAIHEVWCGDDEERWQLKRYPYVTLRDNYPDLVSAEDGGAPLYYAPIWVRPAPGGGTDYQSLGTFFNYIKTDDDGTYNGVLFVPKTDKAYNIEVVGKFSHVALADNNDENFWTNASPELVLKAALYQHDVLYRGAKSAGYWQQFIEDDGVLLEKTLVDQESSDERVLE